MNLGLVLRSWRETRGLTLLCGTAVALFQVLLAILMPLLAEDFSETFFRTRIARFFLSALLGTEVTEVGPSLLTAFAWTHPIVLTIFFAHAITYATRVPAAEVDRGTIDQLLALPVSRVTVFLSEACAWISSTAALGVFALLGSAIGTAFAGGGGQPSPLELVPVVVNLWALTLAVGALAWLFASGAERRGRAVAWPIGILLVSSLINFLAAVWAPARAVSFLSILGYYGPMQILTFDVWPFGDLGILLGFTLVAGAAACWIFRRRDC